MSISEKFTNICDICGKPRNTGGHPICSKKRQLLNKTGLTNAEKPVKKQYRPIDGENAIKYFKTL